jgi:HK97 gp10 family phage protein
MSLISRLPQIIAGAEVGADIVVAKAAHDIELGCKKRSRVDTGTMRAGWQAHESPGVGWVVFNPVQYTVYNEYGTIYMSAQPMLRPAIEEVRPQFEKELAALYR